MKGKSIMVIIEYITLYQKSPYGKEMVMFFSRLTRVGFCLMILCAPSLVLAHGTEGSLKEGKGWMIEAFYDDGEAMSYTETQVFHEPSTMPFQTGRTDKNGCFLFSPDGPGTWRVEVKDEMGHAVILKTEITDNPGSSKNESIPGPEASSKGRDKVGGLMAGLGIITFVFGLYFWVSARKLRHMDQP